MNRWEVQVGDCVDLMAQMEEASVDAVVCDPPYHLSFMNREWDAALPPEESQKMHRLWAEQALRVLKPGGYLLAFGSPRTYHRLAAGVEDAGFEVRDQIMWITAQGFPKSLSVHKATLKTIESRYGSTETCDCLDTGDGRAVGDDERRSGGTEVGPSGRPGSIPPTSAGAANSSGNGRAGDASLCELRGDDDQAAQGAEAVGEAVLLDGVRECGAKAPGLGDAEVRGGLEEPSSADSQAGQSLPGVRQDAGGKRLGPSCSPSEALPRGRDESPEQLSGAVRVLPSPDRGVDDADARLDPSRGHPRRVMPDDCFSGGCAVVRVCSWCGRPDQDWLDSLKPLGSALKPAHEPIIVARKPLGGTVAANALKFGTGALNIDACRVGVGEGREREGEESAERRYTERGSTDFAPTLGPRGGDAKGRWPANLVLSHAEECGDLCVEGCPVASLNEQSGERRGGGYPEQRSANSVFNPTSGGSSGPRSFGDSGGAARFFFTSKTSRAERDAGLDETFAVKPLNWSSGEQSPGTFQSEGTEKAARNNHPTVKPIDLMRWLCRLVTPEGGLILDPFAGSGTTGCAAVLEGFRFVGYEKQEEYYRIAVARIKHWSLFEGNDTERALASSVRTQTRLEAGQIGLLDKEA